jgi:hypothetical protein
MGLSCQLCFCSVSKHNLLNPQQLLGTFQQRLDIHLVLVVPGIRPVAKARASPSPTTSAYPLDEVVAKNSRDCRVSPGGPSG